MVGPAMLRQRQLVLAVRRLRPGLCWVGMLLHPWMPLRSPRTLPLQALPWPVECAVAAAVGERGSDRVSPS